MSKMNDSVSKASFLSIILIVLSAVIGLGFIVCTSARGVTDSMVNQTESTMSAITQADLLAYNQSEVTGLEVVETYYRLKGIPIAVLIHNASMEHNIKTFITEDNNPATPDPSPYAIEIERVQAGTNTIEKIQCLNYNALLASNEQGTKPTELAKTGVVVANGSQGVLTFEKGVGYKAKYSFALNLVEGSEKGKILWNTGATGLQKERTCEYIPLGAIYETSLIKSSDGTIMGIVFIQKGK